jgi:molecular chaperone GrpE (heat shock protein)
MAHAHPHEHPAGDDLAKLRALLPHWIEHNEEHAASFREWAARAREHGQEDVAEAIAQAAQRMEDVNAALERALQALEAGRTQGG